MKIDFKTVLFLAIIIIGAIGLITFAVQGDRDMAVENSATSTPATSTPATATSSPSDFPEAVDEANKMRDKIRVSFPQVSDRISSPLVVTGEARGTWFFEASFPVTLTNWDGLIIAEGYAQAEGEWMTEDFVPFKATLNFTKPSYGERGFLILQKDNPSGLPQNDAALEIPIYFK